MTHAVIHLCLDLTDPDAISYPLFLVFISKGHLVVEFLLSPSAIDSLLSKDPLISVIVDRFPLLAGNILEDSGPSGFFDSLSVAMRFSTLSVEVKPY